MKNILKIRLQYLILSCILACAPYAQTIQAQSWISKFFTSNDTVKTEKVASKQKFTLVKKPKEQAKQHVIVPAAPMAENAWVPTKDLKSRFDFHVYDKSNNTCGIRSHETYRPAGQLANARPIVIAVIHGTWATDNTEYHSEDKPFYRCVRDYARITAHRKQVPVEVISFKWTGNNKSTARHDAALVLASLFSHYYNNAEIVTIAHSHGCNVVASASRMLDSSIAIDHIINIAAPVRDETDPEFKPQNFKRLTQFYSTVDLVAAAGALTQWNFYAKEGSIRKFAHQPGRIVTNVRTQINGTEPGHSGIKALVHYLPNILDKIDTYYKYNSDLDLDINLESDQLRQQYSQAAQDPVLISVRHYTNAQQQLAAIPEVDMLGVAQQFAQEYIYSEMQRSAYRERYSQEMSDKSNAFVRFFTGIKQHFARYQY